MQYGSIPGLGKKVSRVVYGTLFLHTADHAFHLLDKVWDSGCTAFDCAKERKISRERVVVVTKGGCHGQDKLWSANISEEAIRADIRGSCERLGIGHVDVFMLHRDDPAIPVEAIVDMMDKFQREALVTVWGVSNWALERLQAALEYSRRSGKSEPVCDSLQFSLAHPTRSVWPDTQFMTSEARERYASSGTAVLAWECLAKGFMAGKKWDRSAVALAKRAVEHPEETAHLKPTGPTAAEWRELQLMIAYCTDDNFDRRERAAVAAQATGLSLARIALKYVASQPFESFVLVGTTKVENWLENAGGGAAPRLTPAELAWLETGKGVCPFPLPASVSKQRRALDGAA